MDGIMKRDNSLLEKAMTEKSVLERLREDLAKVCEQAAAPHSACGVPPMTSPTMTINSGWLTGHLVDCPIGLAAAIRAHDLSIYESATPAPGATAEASDPRTAEALGAHGAADPDVASLIAWLLDGSMQSLNGWGALRREAAAALQRQADQLAEVRKDAERYRWLRDYSKPEGVISPFYLSVVEAFKETRFRPEQVDARIDAALSEGKP